MKKVVGIFMAMVFLFIVMSMAMASGNPKGYCGSEVANMLEDWIRSQKCELYLGGFDQGVKYEYGVLCTSDFKDLTGEDFTMKGLEDLYSKAFETSDVNIRLAGFSEGYDVYILDIKTDAMPLGNYDGTNYYRGSAVFMILED